jgi:hypothetical protein
VLFSVSVPLFKDQFLKRDFFDSFNETVEKLFFLRAIPGRAMIGSAISCPEGD